jgi:hypothetical protein
MRNSVQDAINAAIRAEARETPIARSVQKTPLSSPHSGFFVPHSQGPERRRSGFFGHSENDTRPRFRWM